MATTRIRFVYAACLAVSGLTVGAFVAALSPQVQVVVIALYLSAGIYGLSYYAGKYVDYLLRRKS